MGGNREQVAKSEMLWQALFTRDFLVQAVLNKRTPSKLASALPTPTSLATTPPCADTDTLVVADTSESPVHDGNVITGWFEAYKLASAKLVWSQLHTDPSLKITSQGRSVVRNGMGFCPKAITAIPLYKRTYVLRVGLQSWGDVALLHSAPTQADATSRYPQHYFCEFIDNSAVYTSSSFLWNTGLTSVCYCLGGDETHMSTNHTDLRFITNPTANQTTESGRSSIRCLEIHVVDIATAKTATTQEKSQNQQQQEVHWYLDSSPLATPSASSLLLSEQLERTPAHMRNATANLQLLGVTPAPPAPFYLAYCSGYSQGECALLWYQ
eukprot:TRINITY_DN6584_c0_g1_i2.p1 TRINITY_DN6584_c0_g1~~TRINITY_DN6584_c0_g1_i2.p1  ORF type:complete len:325 (+),score=56.37 TRINITY_DN6584_c0_g1_i2:65-1039(+)